MHLILLMVFGQTLTVALIRSRLLHGSAYSTAQFRRELLFALPLCAMFVASLNLTLIMLPFPVTTSIALAVLSASYEAIDAHSRYYFDTSFSKLLPHLPISFTKSSSFKSSCAYVIQYFRFKYWIASLAIWTTATAILSQIANPSVRTSIAFVVLTVFVFYVRTRLTTSSESSITDVQRLFLLATDEPIPVGPLRAQPRYHNIDLKTDVTSSLPQTIIIIINESAGGELRSSSNSETLLSEKICAIGGSGMGRWFVPENVVTNSSCTDISIPSILTGCGSHEGIDKLHRMPFVFDLAKARGYSTGFFTSSTLKWANFDQFFSEAKIDELLCADSLDEAFINDLAIDDYIAVHSASNWVTNQEGKVLLVLYLNSLHKPFQSDSLFDIPGSLVSRRERATFITEASHRVIFEGLKKINRFNDAMIFSIGDHGETSEPADSNAGPRGARVTNLTQEVLRPLFVMKASENTSHKFLDQMARNTSALIANIDVAPTISNVLGAAPSGENLSFQGYSIFQPIPDSRVAYTVNTNEWRSWAKSAVAIARGFSRTIVDYQSDNLVTHVGSASDNVDSGEADTLLLSGMSEPLVRQSISTIFRDKMQERRLVLSN